MPVSRLRVLGLLAFVIAVLAPELARSQATGTEYVTFWRGDLRVLSTEPDTFVEIINIDGGATLATATLANVGDSYESFSGAERRVRVLSSDASGAGAAKPVVVWTGYLEPGLKHPSFPPFSNNPWLSYVPAVSGTELRNGTELGREFIGFTSRELYVFARKGSDPTSIQVEDLVTNVDSDSDDTQTLDASSPSLLYSDAEVEIFYLDGFEDDTLRVTSNVDTSLLVGIASRTASDWTASPPSYAAGDDGVELGTLFYTFVERTLAIFPTEDATTVTITDLSDGDDDRTVFLANGDLANPNYDIYVPVLSTRNGASISPRAFGPDVAISTNGVNAFDDDLVKVSSDKPILVSVGPAGSDVNEFADVAFSVATGPASRLVYIFAQNGGARDLQLFTFDDTTNVDITSLTRTLGFGTASHHDVLLPPYTGGHTNGLGEEFYYYASGAWAGEFLRVESDAPVVVIGGDYDKGNFGAFIPFVLTTPELPPIAVAIGPVSACPGELVQLDGTGSFDQDDLDGPETETYEWDCDIAVDSNGNGVTDDDLDATGPVVTCSWSTLGTQTARLTFTDDEGVSDSDDVSVVVEDTVPPVFTNCPASLLLDCTDVIPVEDAVAEDDCGEPTIVYTETRADGPCPESYTITRMWMATDVGGNVTTCTQFLTVVDDTPPTVSGVLSPRDPEPAVSARSALSPLAPRSVCSSPTSRFFEIECTAADDCDPAPVVEATLLAVSHQVQLDGECLELMESIPVACGEIVELRLAAPPCPASSVRSLSAPRSALEVTSKGAKIVTGESLILQVSATDACGNVSVATFDPASEPEPDCEEPLIDGTCCPAIAAPEGEGCPVPPCGSDVMTFTGLSEPDENLDLGRPPTRERRSFGRRSRRR